MNEATKNKGSQKVNNKYKGITTTSTRVEELRFDRSTRIESEFVVATPKGEKSYYYWATFKHRIKGNRSTYGGWPSRKSSLELELWARGYKQKQAWKSASEVPSQHRRAWDFIQKSAPLAFKSVKNNQK
jgi:hypothetical protein